MTVLTTHIHMNTTNNHKTNIVDPNQTKGPQIAAFC